MRELIRVTVVAARFNRDRCHLSLTRVRGAARMNGNPIAGEVLA
jgi:hypothetical protein